MTLKLYSIKGENQCLLNSYSWSKFLIVKDHTRESYCSNAGYLAKDIDSSG